MREELHNVMGLDPESEKISSDVDLLDTYYACKFFFYIWDYGLLQTFIYFTFEGMCASSGQDVHIISTAITTDNEESDVERG